MNLNVLSIDKYYLKELAEIAKVSLPAEGCAILLGKIEPINNYTVKKIMIMDNIVKARDYFEINPSNLLEVYIKTQAMNLDVIAIFHSHPSIAYPSKTDIIFMEINPVIWLIYSTTECIFKAFILNEKKKIIEVLIREVKA